MPDRESVIIGLRSCKPSWFTVEKCNNDSCPYNRFGHEDGGCVDHLIDDALELLTEQKTVRNSIFRKQMDAWMKDRQQDGWTNRVHEMGGIKDEYNENE